MDQKKVEADVTLESRRIEQGNSSLRTVVARTNRMSHAASKLSAQCEISHHLTLSETCLKENVTVKAFGNPLHFVYILISSSFFLVCIE